ncbi:hypothetical protein HHX47_DHR5000639 [Lentinula edodes]|nr:hypothetical protein HHX47_DHR5000639 [Lentinula edodes]
MTDTGVRDMFISSVTKFASSGMSSQPLTDWYDAASGMSETFRARPVVGGHHLVHLLINSLAATVRQSPILVQPTLRRLHPTRIRVMLPQTSV